MECCENCACYETEWEYCFRLGAHAPKDGYCKNYREELKLPKGGISMDEKTMAFTAPGSFAASTYLR